jgi:hypothetical protein
MSEWDFSGYNPYGTKKKNKSLSDIWILDYQDGYLKSIGGGPEAAPQSYLLELGSEAAAFSTSIDAIIKYYTSTGQMNKLKAKMSKVMGTNFLVGDNTFRIAIAELVKQATAYNFTQTNMAAQGQKGKLISLLGYLDVMAKGGGGGGSTEPTNFLTLTGRQQAWGMFSDLTWQITGRKPNKKEFENFFKELGQYEKGFVSTRKDSGRTRTETNNQSDPQKFALRYIVKQLDQDDNLKGAANQFMQRIEQAMEDNGVADYFTDKTKIKFLRQLLTQKMSEEDLLDVLRKRSMAVYTQWAQEMADNPEMSFADLIKPYAEQYQNVLEINGPVKVSDVAKLAMSGDRKLNALEFEQALRKDPRWAKTKQANIEAGDLAKSFARSLGVNV